MQDRFEDGEDEPPPIRLVVAEGGEDVTIKVSDEGGGIPRSGLPRIWSYLYSTAKSPVVLDDAAVESGGPNVLAGYGYGLPIRCVCAWRCRRCCWRLLLFVFVLLLCRVLCACFCRVPPHRTAQRTTTRPRINTQHHTAPPSLSTQPPINTNQHQSTPITIITPPSPKHHHHRQNTLSTPITINITNSRLYARYFGGDLQIISMEGYGTDAYLHLNRLGNVQEPLP